VGVGQTGLHDRCEHCLRILCVRALRRGSGHVGSTAGQYLALVAAGTVISSAGLILATPAIMMSVLDAQTRMTVTDFLGLTYPLALFPSPQHGCRLILGGVGARTTRE